jgi:long-chain acyl-CoA synthetase
MTSALVAGLERNARERGETLAVREIGRGAAVRTFDWQTLHAAVAGLSHRLESRLRDDASLLVCGGNRFELLVALAAGLHAGAAVAPVAPESTPSELLALCTAVGARVAIGPPDVLAVLAAKGVEGIALGDLGASDGLRTPPAPSGSRAGGASLLLRSSGTTGPPKIVRRTAVALDAVGDACRAAIRVGPDDVMLLAIPLYHSYGIDMAMLTALPAGAALELHQRFEAGTVRTSLAERGTTIFPAVPVMLHALGRGPAGGLRAPHLRRVVSAGSPLSSEVAERFRAAAGVPVGQIYGATEFGSVLYNDPERWDEKRDGPFRPECVGSPLPGVRIRIASPDDPARELAPGSEGQVAIASPSLLSSYVGETEPPTCDGFLATGDLGRLDAAGRLALTGRQKLMIDVGGLKVNPLEVEAVLLRHPSVRDVVAFPIPYSATASRLKVVVVPEPGAHLTRDEILRFAREHLIHYKVPRSVEITDDVPRSPTGKILRQQLIESAGGSGTS